MARYPDLGDGLLEVGVGGQSAITLSWARVPDPSALSVPGTRRFDGGEGIWFDSRTVILARLRRRLPRGGRHTVHLRLGRRAAARLRGHRGVKAPAPCRRAWPADA
jgi:hypothetical protein